MFVHVANITKLVVDIEVVDIARRIAFYSVRKVKVNMEVFTCNDVLVGGTPDSAADQPKENIEMTQNQVYGVPLTKGTGQEAVTMEENVGYGVTSDSKRNDPQTSQDESYEYI